MARGRWEIVDKTLLLLLPWSAPADPGGPAPSYGGPGLSVAPGARLARWRGRGAEGVRGRSVVRFNHANRRRSLGVEQVSGRSRVRWRRVLEEHVDGDGNRVIDVRGLSLDEDNLQRLLLLL